MKISSILAVLELNQENRFIIERALLIAERYQARVTFLVPCYSPGLESSYLFDAKAKEEAHNGFLHGQKKRFAPVIQQAQGRSVEAELRVVWNKHIHDAVSHELEQTTYDLVLKSTQPHSLIARAFITYADWRLIRTVPLPLLLVKNREYGSHLNLMAAVDPMHAHAEPSGLDKKILELSHDFACTLPAELHVAHAFEPIPTGVITEFDVIAADYEKYREKAREKHREALSELLESAVEKETFSHFEEGSAEQVIPQLVSENAVDVLVMGAVSRGALDKLFIGSTAERILDAVDCDVLVVK